MGVRLLYPTQYVDSVESATTRLSRTGRGNGEVVKRYLFLSERVECRDDFFLQDFGGLLSEW